MKSYDISSTGKIVWMQPYTDLNEVFATREDLEEILAKMKEKEMKI
jgi:glycosidase